MRNALLILFIMLNAGPAWTQELSGVLEVPRPEGYRLVLLATRGSEHYPVDSVRPGADGRFHFGTGNLPGSGFYQLALNDSDRVDVILDRREQAVQLRLTGRPLQSHMAVVSSGENTRLWRYKLVSRETQAVQESIARERQALDPLAFRRLQELDSMDRRAVQVREDRLEALINEAPDSYFARVVKASKAIDREVPNGPAAVASAFAFSEPDMLRSSVYDKAIMGFLQSINVISEEQMSNAADSLLLLASVDKDCQTYMIEHLVDLFTVYGPQSTLQHLVDTYLAGDDPALSMSPKLRAQVERLLAVSIGAIGPDVDLVDTTGGRTPLSVVAGRQRYTVLFFYSSTCDHCHAQMPGLNELYARYQPLGLGVVGIALDDDTTEFRTNIRRRELRFPCFSEFNGWGSLPARAYEVKATPTLIVLDERRRIVAKPYDSQALAKELAVLMP